jgi:malate dehydrogenase (oxaloacetate-decarboxylating)(NADP+)
LGVIVSGATRVTDEMFMAAAQSLAHDVTDTDLAQGSLYPPLADIRAVSAHIAAAVARVAYDRKLAAGTAPADLLAFVKSRMYEPRYRNHSN